MGPEIAAAAAPAGVGIGTQAAAGLLQGGLDFGASQLANWQNRKFALKMYDKQYADNIKLWQMQNAYNSPAEQVKRYQAAGLNPALMYGSGSGSAGNASAPSPASAPSYKAIPAQLNLANGMAVLNNYMDLKAKEIQVENYKVDLWKNLVDYELAAETKMYKKNIMESKQYQESYKKALLMEEWELREEFAQAKLSVMETNANKNASQSQKDAEIANYYALENGMRERGLSFGDNIIYRGLGSKGASILGVTERVLGMITGGFVGKMLGGALSGRQTPMPTIPTKGVRFVRPQGKTINENYQFLHRGNTINDMY